MSCETDTPAVTFELNLCTGIFTFPYPTAIADKRYTWLLITTVSAQCAVVNQRAQGLLSIVYALSDHDVTIRRDGRKSSCHFELDHA